MPDVTSAVFILAILLLLVAEAWRSRANEQSLRGLGACEPPGDVYQWMQIAYPACFGLMIVEGLLAPGRGAPSVGAGLFIAAKALKYWAMATLGARWCFRVLVPPHSAPVVLGPYRWVRHPNYVAVALELAAVALFFGAWRTGPACAAVFVWLMWRRVRVEDRALGYDAVMREPPAMSPHTDPVADVPRWVRVCDRLTVATLAVLASLLAFGPLRIMAGDGRITLSSIARAIVVLVVVAGVRHWRVPTPHLGSRLWTGLRRTIRSGAWQTAWLSFVAVRVPVLVVGFLALVMFGYPAPSKTPLPRGAASEVLNLPVRWDAAWYIGIAIDGYQYDPRSRGQQTIAFFPAYPALMRTAGALIGARAKEGIGAYADLVAQRLQRTVLAGWLVALACGIWGMAKLYRFALDCGADQGRAGAVVMLAAAYPFAYFYGALYTESLFLVAVVATFAAFVRRDYLVAACWGVLVGLSRPNGCLVSIPLAMIATQQAFFPATLRRGDGTPMADGWRTWAPAMVTAAVPGLAMLAFTAWLYSFTGLGIAWLQAHKAWGREYHSLAGLLGEQMRVITGEGIVGYVMRQPIDVVNAAAVLFVVAMAIPVARVLGIAYSVLLLINILPPLMAGGFLSLGRVSSTLFPMFICLGLTLRPSTLAWLLTAWGVGQGLLAALFFSWRPIY